ncbi:uncharacterized protein LOC130447084 [Diorhabda sublineata]|uniref:uncharacterized protein LOC130447084 n=1 Tax=Diorhabda sublineata TaxID=1163346 RepID=UPI0024E17A5D|nr:uncharacterized protein LOC130447084 [Diorhabda sublineata]
MNCFLYMIKNPYWIHSLVRSSLNNDYTQTHDVIILLKKYPFSKLTKIQASQIELLTQVFTQESLIIKVGNLEFGVPVLASVADNALAYFFVVTQFIQMFK